MRRQAPLLRQQTLDPIDHIVPPENTALHSLHGLDSRDRLVQGGQHLLLRLAVNLGVLFAHGSVLLDVLWHHGEFFDPIIVICNQQLNI